MTYDVAIVGSGPAGSAAALTLAERGVRATIIERAQLPRYKTCGGAIVFRARNLLPFDITPVTERTFVRAQMNLLDSGLSFEARRSQPIISMTMRAQFDELLVRKAQELGAELLSGCEVVSLSYRNTHVQLTTRNGVISARLVIAADGANSTVAKAGGWKETRSLIPAIECELYVNDEDMDRFQETVRFDFDVPPHGYAWVFPKDDHLSVGVLSVRRSNVHLQQALREYLNQLAIRNTLKMERHGFVIPVSPRRDGFARNRLLLTGDAAGFADPVTAEGISFAIRSGQLAAEALIEGDLNEQLCARLYAEKVESQF